MNALEAILVASLATTSGCALLSKSEPMTPRYFSVDPPAAGDRAHGEPVAESGLELRLGRVGGGASIQDRIAYSDSKYEIGYYEQRLWTDKPEVYVQRALARALFERRGVRQIVSGAGTTLEVQVVAFEELRAPAHVGHVELSYRVVDERVVRLSRSIAVDRPIAAAKGDAEAGALVLALSEAMGEAVDMVADAAVAELHTEPATVGATH